MFAIQYISKGTKMTSSESFDVVIAGGTVVDGTGGPRSFADVGVRDGRIAAVGSLGGSMTNRTIDATGKVVAPGVIDVHTHYDGQIFWDPWCTSSGWHGMTTAVVSNCGFGFAPCERRPEVQERYMALMECTEQIPASALRKALPFTWESFPEWLDVVRGIPKGVNVASYLPLNSLMIFVMGSVEDARDRAPTEAEVTRMQALLGEAMDAGAVGFAFSKLGDWNSHKDHGKPMPTDAADPSIAYRLAEVLRDRGEGVIQALVDLPLAVDNNHIAEELARISGQPVLQNIVVPFDHAPHEVERVLKWLDACVERGLDVYSQALAFRTWTESNVLDWTTWDVVAPLAELSALGADVEARVQLVSDRVWRDRVKAVYSAETMTSAGGLFEHLLLLDAHGTRYASYEGRTFGELARADGQHVVDAFFDVVAATRCLVDFRTVNNVSEDPGLYQRLYGHPRVIAGTSDGGAHVKFFCGGQFSTDLLTWLARDEGRFTLEELHHKLSLLPARVMGFGERGALRPGWAADVMVYDLAELGYPSTYEKLDDLPGGGYRRAAPARGIEAILVNGVVTFEADGACTGATPGRVLSGRSA
jgi:N-acyl-D-amino-acid deacylase